MYPLAVCYTVRSYSYNVLQYNVRCYSVLKCTLLQRFEQR